MADNKLTQGRNFLERAGVKLQDIGVVSTAVTGGAFWLTHEVVARNIGRTDALFVTAALCCVGPPATIAAGWSIIKRLTDDNPNNGPSFAARLRGWREQIYSTGTGEQPDEQAPAAALPPMPNWYETVEDVRNLRIPVFPIGQRLTGGTAVIDFRKTPHLAVNGQTGSGKTRTILRPLAAMAAASGLFQVVILDKAGTNFHALRDMRNVWIVRYDHEQLPDIAEAIYAQIMRRDRWMYSRGKGETEIARMRADVRPPSVLVIMDEFANSMTYLQTLPDKSLFNRMTSSMVQITQEGRRMGFHAVLGLQRPDATQINTTLRGQLNGITFHMRDKTDARLADAPGADELPEGQAILSTPGGYETVRTFHPSDDELIAFAQSAKPKDLGEPEWLNGFLSGGGQTITAARIGKPVLVLDAVKNGTNGNGFSRVEVHKNGQERGIKNAPAVPELTADAVMKFFAVRYEKHPDFKQAPDTLTKERVITTALALFVHMSQNEILRAVYGQEKGKEGGRFRDYVKLVERHLGVLELAWVRHYSKVPA